MVEDAETADPSGLDIALFSAGGATSKALAEKEGVECARVSDQPLVYGWDAFEVSCDFETGRAQVLFGRELCDETEIVAAAIGKATATVKERHESWRGQPTAELFARLRRAYVMAAAATDAASGARVAIVDLIVPLANLITAPARWRQKGPEGLSPYPRERLVVELHQLRRQAALEAGGLRLELGVATLWKDFTVEPGRVDLAQLATIGDDPWQDLVNVGAEICSCYFHGAGTPSVDAVTRGILAAARRLARSILVENTCPVM